MIEKTDFKYFYEGIEAHRLLYQNAHSSVKGHINFENIELGVVGINQRNMDAVERRMLELIEEHGEEELKQIPGGKWEEFGLSPEAIACLQVLYHESVHVYQAFTLHCANDFVMQTRSLTDWEGYVAMQHMHKGGKWRFGENLVNRRVLAPMEEVDDDFRIVIRDVSMQQQHASIRIQQKRLYSLTVLELMEGQAIAFQYYATDSYEQFMLRSPDNSIYGNALRIFKNEVSNIDALPTSIWLEVFLLLTDSALRYGDYMLHDESLSPQGLFQQLLKNVGTYLSYNQKAFGPDKYPPGYSEYSCKVLPLDLGKFNKEHFIKLCYLMETMKRDVEQCFRVSLEKNRPDLNGERLSDRIDRVMKVKQRLHYDRKMKPLEKILRNQLPYVFQPEGYILLMVSFSAMDGFSSTMRSRELDESLMADINHNQEIPFHIDNRILETFRKLRRYVRYQATYCCRKHQQTKDRSLIENCTEPDSLNMDLYHMSGKRFSLKSLIDR